METKCFVVVLFINAFMYSGSHKFSTSNPLPQSYIFYKSEILKLPMCAIEVATTR